MYSYLEKGSLSLSGLGRAWSLCRGRAGGGLSALEPPPGSALALAELVLAGPGYAGFRVSCFGCRV